MCTFRRSKDYPHLNACLEEECVHTSLKFAVDRFLQLRQENSEQVPVEVTRQLFQIAGTNTLEDIRRGGFDAELMTQIAQIAVEQHMVSTEERFKDHLRDYAGVRLN